MKRVMSGVEFCEQFRSMESAKTKPQQPVVPDAVAKCLPSRDDYLRMIDLVFEKAGLEDDASEQMVEELLGEAGLRTVLMFYNMANRPEVLAREMTPVTASSVSVGGGEPSSSDSESAGRVPNSEEGSERDVASLYTVPDISVSLPPRKRRAVVSSAPARAPAPKSPQQYKAETEIALSRIFQLGKVAPVLKPGIEPYAPYNGPNVLTMTGFGELGRWGNQILQYAFLVCAAQKTGAKIQVPHWVGTDLFELDNTPVVRRLPSVVEDRTKKANSTFTDEFMEYIQMSNAGCEVSQVFEDVLDASKPEATINNVDVWGWFQWHTRAYVPHKQLLLDTFKPAADVTSHLDKIIETKLRGGKKTTVVGLHLRLGDYKNISASSFGYCAPTSWYLEWLEKIWPTLENPVLFVASDEVDTVLRDFSAYNPVTSDMLGAALPDSRKALGAGFFPDWYILSQCDVLAISNSSFSFTACMLNARPDARFFRAHYADKIVEFDPWDAEPIVHREDEGNALKRISSTLSILYNTQGTKGVMKNLLYELPYQGVRSVVMKAVLRARATRVSA